MMRPSDLLSPWLWACARHRVGTCKSTQPRSQMYMPSQAMGQKLSSSSRDERAGMRYAQASACVRTHDLMSMDGTPAQGA